MKGDVSGVRIIPNEITFADTQVNTVYAVNITVKNISTSSKGIPYYAPQTKVSETCLSLYSHELPITFYTFLYIGGYISNSICTVENLHFDL